MNILRESAFLLIVVALIPINAGAHCKGKHTGNHEHCVGGGDDGSGEYFGSDGVEFRYPSGVAGFDYHIIGTSGGDTITGGDGADLIEGRDGGDEINALGGDDEIRGEDGSDGIDAGEGDDFVYGEAGADSLNGGPGTDWIEGGDGNDALYFSLGASLGGATYDVDHFDGGLGYDTLIFGDWAGPGGYAQINHVTVDLSLNTYEANVTDLAGENVTVHDNDIWSIEDIWGSYGNDVLKGSESTVTEPGTPWDNWISGSEGDDEIRGLSGDDHLDGGQGNDEVYGGPGNDHVGGGPGADLVVGGDGDDLVSGAESGVGDLSDDVLWGGNGCDIFLFRSNFGTDTVMDYEPCEQIHLAGYTGGFWRNDLDFSVININIVGADIVVDFWLKRGGGTGGTIILEDAAANGIVVDESDFIIGERIEDHPARTY